MYSHPHIFQASKKCRWTAWGGALWFAVFATFQVIVFTMAPPHGPEPDAPLRWVFAYGFPLLFLFFAGLGVVEARGTANFELEIDSQRIRQRFGKNEFELAAADVRAVQWPVEDSPVRIETREPRRELRLGLLAPADRLTAVRLLREMFRNVPQTGWERYCARTLYADLWRTANTPLELLPEEILVTRARYRSWMLGMSGVLIVAAPVFVWLSGNPGFWALPLAPWWLWGLLYYSTGRRGEIMTGIGKLSPGLPLVLSEALLAVLVMMSIPVLEVWGLPPAGRIVLWVIVVVLAGDFIRRMVRSDKVDAPRREEYRRQREVRALAAWERWLG